MVAQPFEAGQIDQKGAGRHDLRLDLNKRELFSQDQAVAGKPRLPSVVAPQLTLYTATAWRLPIAQPFKAGDYNSNPCRCNSA